MATITLPVDGEKNWGNKLNVAINAINGEVVTVHLTVAELDALVSDGRLSESSLAEQIAAGGGGGMTFVEDPNDPGLYFIPASLVEDPDHPGLYLIGS